MLDLCHKRAVFVYNTLGEREKICHAASYERDHRFHIRQLDSGLIGNTVWISTLLLLIDLIQSPFHRTILLVIVKIEEITESLLHIDLHLSDLQVY